MNIAVRPATKLDADAMSRILRRILHVWNSNRPGSAAHVTAHYVEHPDSLCCCVATGSNGDLLGFQSLKIATDGNPYDLPVGWGIIGTYVDARARGKGVGRALFTATLEAAQDARLTVIDATIGASNLAGIGYYEALGFRTYLELDGAVGKKLLLS